jgi:hypothetical protein
MQGLAPMGETLLFIDGSDYCDVQLRLAPCLGMNTEQQNKAGLVEDREAGHNPV